MVSVLITAIGSTTAISVLKGLRKQREIRVRIIGVDAKKKNEIAGSRFCDAFYTLPHCSRKDYIPKMLRLCKKENIRVIFPIIDSELEAVSRNIGVFRKHGIFVWVSDNGTIHTCNDKYLTYEFFTENNIPTPRTFLPGKTAIKMRFPVFVKPRKGISSINTHKVNSPENLKALLRENQDMIVQEYLDGTEYTLDVLCDAESRVLSVVPRERIETKAGISYKGITVRDNKLIAYGREIAEKLKIKGACNIQGKVSRGKASFFEVNPRFSAAFTLTLEAGVNSPLILLKLALGKKLSKKYYDFKEGIYMARYWSEVFWKNKSKDYH